MLLIGSPLRHKLLAIVCVLLLGHAGLAQAQFDSFPSFSGFGGAEESNDVSVSAEFVPAADGSPAQLTITASIPEGFHIYAIDQGTLPNNGGGPMATVISLAPEAPVKLLGDWQPKEAPKSHLDEEIWTGLELREHEVEVTWTAPVEVVPGSAPDIVGRVEGQSCNPHTCIPFEQEFSVSLGSEFAPAQPPAGPLGAEGNSSAADAKTAVAPDGYDLSQVVLTQSEQSILYYLISAFLGGIVLNVMPCVLPVIGLKVMSFVQQAGQSRAQALALNCWYSAGIVSVFLILASLAVSLQLGWGGQFGSAGFNLSLIGIVFAMALSMLGMWDIPIPGFVGGSTAMNAAEREGPMAAYLKGVLTTLLATPCTGPLMGAALAWSVKQPAGVTYSVFAALGLGMASPYLLIGAFPSLVSFLPKPGAWMETFKKVTGFILMGTVVWLMSFIDASLLVPTAAMLLGISIACWWVSKTPLTAPTLQKIYAWTTAGLIAGISALGSFGILHPIMQERFDEEVAAFAASRIETKTKEIATKLAEVQSLDELAQLADRFADPAAEDTGRPWQPFSLKKLEHIAIDQGRTVMVDFTADWCTNCKALEKFVLKTDPVNQAVAQAGIVTMEADNTDQPPEIVETIRALGGSGVPVVAIFPASAPYEPIVFADGQYTQDDLIEAISKATGQQASLSSSLGSAEIR